MSRHRAVCLVDASPYIFRSFFSLPSTMLDRRGRPVGAIYGFLSFLLKLIRLESPNHLGIVFDGSLTTSFRNELFPEYKSGREPPPPELEAQLEDCRKVACYLGGATYVDPKYEADDLLGTLCRRLESERRGAVIVSPDKDLAQLVNPRVSLLDFARGRRFTPREVQRRFLVRPEQIPDLLGLAGDPVDSIPGVAGIGRKTAVSLLGVFDHLEDLYADLDRVRELPLRGARSIADKLARDRKRALLSKQLATIVTEAPIEGKLDRLAWTGPRWDRLDPLLDALGFQGIRARIPGATFGESAGRENSG